MRKSAVVEIRPKAATPTDNTPPTGGGSASRRTTIMRLSITGRDRASSELTDRIDHGAQFLTATRDDIIARFLRGVAEIEITRVMGGKRYNVCRLDIESVIRAGFQSERAARIELERLARMRVAA